ncbi:Aspartyl protease [Andreprevotia lacus DSM 23236]|uniref:Aspartyl protease n=1 Tax=Andreprevotia lacus DSM 23236 TaxID=1121001 RepID=A0A1W1XYY4_9NEIS|nr:hypothetical protein [Andreprevotia lacus]SMC29123.1 Aspartyl protease [Andreprevotia lacus DSM 23236]
MTFPLWPRLLCALALCSSLAHAADVSPASEETEAAAPAEDAAVTHAYEILTQARAAFGVEAFQKLGSYTLSGSGTLQQGKQSTAVERFDLQVDARRGMFVQSLKPAGVPATVRSGFDGSSFWMVPGDGAKRDANLASLHARLQGQIRSYAPLRDDPHSQYVRWQGSEGCGEQMCDTLHFDPSGQSAFELAIRRSDHRIAILRVLDEQNKVTLREEYTAWQTVAGVQLPARMRTDFGSGVLDLQLTATVSTRPAEYSTFAAPPAIPPWQFAEGTKQVELPIELVNNQMFIRARLNGQGPFLLMFDTGGSLIIDQGMAEQVKVQAGGAHEFKGGGWSAQRGSLSVVDQLQLGEQGELQLNQWLAPIVDSRVMCGRTKLSLPCAGSIGGDLLRYFPVTLDFERKVLIIHNRDHFTPPEGQTKLAATLYDNHIPQVDGQIEGKPARLLLDSGSDVNLFVTEPYTDNSRLLYKVRTTAVYLMGWGYGGGMHGRLARMNEFGPGEFKLKQLSAALLSTADGMLASKDFDALLGLGAMQRFNLTIDMPGNAVYLEKNSHFDQPDTNELRDSWLR